MKLIFEKGMPALTANGILGDPRTASAERGGVYLERFADFLVSKINRNQAADPQRAEKRRIGGR